MGSESEAQRLVENAKREKNWQRWGPYLSERQWATVREDYSPDGTLWESFPYEHSLARAYRWGEDGLLGITDRECRLCFALTLWNEHDPHLKERLFGLTNHEGNHSEDVKEVYFYLDAVPTHTYLKALYKYPQREYPYQPLREENRRRNRTENEFELTDTEAFQDDRYWDVFVEYAKASPDDILARFTLCNRSKEAAKIWVVPTLWFRNTWTWDSSYEEGRWAKPRLARLNGGLLTEHETLGRFRLDAQTKPREWAFTENETNPAIFTEPLSLNPLEGATNGYFKDAFHRLIVQGDRSAVRRDGGTKAAGVYVLEVPAGGEVTLRFRLYEESLKTSDSFAGFDELFTQRIREADEFYAEKIPQDIPPEIQAVSRQAYSGLLWSLQFYHYVIPDWVNGDRNHPNSPEVKSHRLNQNWMHLFSRDVVSTPDKWEYPAFFAWDTAFQMIPMARIDPEFAKGQLILFLREWYLHPSGQLPAFEYDFSNVNPPVHAWAAWQVYEIDGKKDLTFLERIFHKLLMNFTWWVNRKDPSGRGVFSGGFLGMDNLGVFDRSRPLPVKGELDQADGTAWMGFYCTSMLKIALELAMHNRAYEDVASKFFEHFIAIADSLNHLGGRGLWDEEDGFYYDQLLTDGKSIPLKLRGLIGVVPLLAVLILEEDVIVSKLPDFGKRLHWFLTNRTEQYKQISNLEHVGESPKRRGLFALPSRERLTRVLQYLLHENEFLSPFGIRSLSKIYQQNPYIFRPDGDNREFTVAYSPGDMETADFGGNSNWRGPIWFPLNYLVIEAIEQYHLYYGDTFQIECPTGSGRKMNLKEVARELARRLGSLFLPIEGRQRPCHGTYERFRDDPYWKDYILFHEYFHGDNGRGLGASHQTGWTALVATMIETGARNRRREMEKSRVGEV